MCEVMLHCNNHVKHLRCFRLITRAVLVCFNQVTSRTSEEQEQLDVQLEEAMNQAQGSAGLIVSMGKELVANRNELVTTILPHVKEVLPNAIHRAQSSYALALFAVLKVCMYMCVHTKVTG